MIKVVWSGGSAQFVYCFTPSGDYRPGAFVNRPTEVKKTNFMSNAKLVRVETYVPSMCCEVVVGR